MTEQAEQAMINFQIFENANFKVRVTDRDGDPWWVAGDVCGYLGIANTSQACENFDVGQTHAISTRDSMGRPQQTTIIDEPGLYELIGRSRKPEALAFKKWLYREVLP